MSDAVVLLSGGLDSTVALYWARHEGWRVHALTILYGQTHTKETDKARITTKLLDVPHELIDLPLPWKGSALLDPAIAIPCARTINDSDIPVTYVPARNTIFLSVALSWAETIGARAIVIGAHQCDYSGYPDCRRAYFEQMQQAFSLGTKCGVEDRPIGILTPLLDMTKKDIILLGSRLGVPFENTWSCYQGGEQPCGVCDSCILRKKGFKEVCISDPLS